LEHFNTPAPFCRNALLRLAGWFVWLSYDAAVCMAQPSKDWADYNSADLHQC
jgi:hypothetical protein